MIWRRSASAWSFRRFASLAFATSSRCAASESPDTGVGSPLGAGLLGARVSAIAEPFAVVGFALAPPVPFSGGGADDAAAAPAADEGAAGAAFGGADVGGATPSAADGCVAGGGAAVCVGSVGVERPPRARNAPTPAATDAIARTATPAPQNHGVLAAARITADGSFGICVAGAGSRLPAEVPPGDITLVGGGAAGTTADCVDRPCFDPESRRKRFRSAPISAAV